MKKAIVPGTTQIRFTFDNLPEVLFDANKCSEANNDYAVMHGYMARIGDAAALSRKQADGTVITITEEMRRAEVLALVNHYESGSAEWNLAGRTRAAPQNPLWLKLALARNVSYDTIAAEKAAADLAELAALSA